MSVFFRNYFSPRYSPEGSGKAFHSLYELVNKGGGGLFRVLFTVAVIAVVLGFFLSLITFVLSSHGRTMDEAKGKVQRIMWIAFGIGATTGMVALVFKVFNWGF